MIPPNLLPATLKNAPIEEQLSYLLHRRQTIERLLQSLEVYSREREKEPPFDRGGRGPMEKGDSEDFLFLRRTAKLL